jgi:hypothetical protein
METTLCASKFFDNQRRNVDQGLIGSKIFYSNQTHKKGNTSGLQCQREVVKSNTLSFAFLIVDEGLQLSLMTTSLALLASQPSDYASKGFWESTTEKPSGWFLGLIMMSH